MNKPRTFDGNVEPCAVDYLAHSVIEKEEEEWSGLYDSDGNRLYRKKERIGFVRFDDE